MEHREPDGELPFNNRPQEKLKKRSLLLTGLGGSTRNALRIDIRKSGQKAHRDRTGCHAFNRVCGRSVLKSQAKTNWSIQTNRLRFIIPMSVCVGFCVLFLAEGGGYIRGRYWETRETLLTRAVGSLYLVVNLWAIF